MSALPPIPPNITHIAAPLLFGNLWNWTLYGALVVQLYVYSYNFSDDKKLLKLLVYAIFFLETLQTSLSGADLYYWFVSGYGDIRHLVTPYATSFDVLMIEAVVSLSVQFFFVYRIWILGGKKSWWLCFIICLCSTIDAAAAFTGGIYTHVHSRFASGGTLKALAIVWLLGSTIADILIAAMMLYYYLARMHRGMGGSFNDHILLRIVRLIIETNVMTASVGIVSLLLVLIFPREIYYTCPTSIFGKLYSNTLLVSLNNRISLREATAINEVEVISLPVATKPLQVVASRSESNMGTSIERSPIAYKAAAP
ncbi:hypothetical protein BGW80DRAFT_1209494 [Lactifluus volemus]|nr:hypothetical protein BGW80DRAFT_1209494 [Lactifluus volemus]